MAEKWLYMCNK